MKLKPIDKQELGAYWVELDERGTCRITPTTQPLDFQYSVPVHISFVSPFNEIPYWFRIVGSSTEALSGAALDWKPPVIHTGYILESTSRPATKATYKGWCRRV